MKLQQGNAARQRRLGRPRKIMEPARLAQRAKNMNWRWKIVACLWSLALSEKLWAYMKPSPVSAGYVVLTTLVVIYLGGLGLGLYCRDCRKRN